MFRSYAQNFEDVILWRALKSVDIGFYIDIGAQDPIIDSVSKGFSEKGWQGIHVDANNAYAERLRQDRPADIVVHAAVGAEKGLLDFYVIAETGLSTGDPEVARMHIQHGHQVVRNSVPMVSLDDIFELVGLRDVHWLKIDVEGMEKSVLESWRESDLRPWVVVIESTLPNSQTPSFEAWEPFIFGKGYSYAYFDGVNRYYVSDLHKEILKVFGPGPNFFDQFILSDTCHFVDTTRYHGFEQEAVSLREQLDDSEERLSVQKAETESAIINLRQAQNSITQLEQEATELRMKLNGAQLALDELATRNAEFLNSTSWKITAPLRFISFNLKWAFEGIVAWATLKPGSRPRRTARTLLSHAVLWVRMRPRVAKLAMRIVQKLPRLERRLRDLQASIYATGRTPNFVIRPTDLAQSGILLSPRGRAVLADVHEHKMRR
ncbi:methyltransferase FkbM [Brucella anthropi]|nr:methyltransferase FkbM [Brucella anthropi]